MDPTASETVDPSEQFKPDGDESATRSNSCPTTDVFLQKGCSAGDHECEMCTDASCVDCLFALKKTPAVHSNFFKK